MRIETNAARILTRLYQSPATLRQLARSDADKSNTCWVLAQLSHVGALHAVPAGWALTDTGRTLCEIVSHWDTFPRRQDAAMRARLRDKRPRGRGRDWRARQRARPEQGQPCTD